MRRRDLLLTLGSALLVAPVQAAAQSAPAAALLRDDWMLDARWRQPTTAPAATSAPALGALPPTPSAPAFRPLAVPPTRVSAAAPPAVTAQYIAIVDEASGALLFGSGERQRVPPASTTKIATAIVALERAGDRLEERVPITIDGAAMAARGSSVMGLEPGESLTLRTLLYGLMLPSGNDAAEQIALAVGGTRERFIAWMNERAAGLGLRDTQFANPHGLDNRNHWSSAYDLTMLARYGMTSMPRSDVFRALAAAATYRAEGYNLKNLNRLIGSYPGADGVKIGFTGAAGKTMVSSATRGGRRVYVSVFKSQDLPGDASALFDWTWSSFRWA